VRCLGKLGYQARSSMMCGRLAVCQSLERVAAGAGPSWPCLKFLKEGGTVEQAVVGTGRFVSLRLPE
ncbi:MAG: hypothetical protein ACI82F_002670, partial [Planctomycetota bacterium]